MRIKEIDNLRGLAVFLVFLAHAGFYNFSEKISTPIWGNLSGLVGVYIFFIVSGYCIINSINKIQSGDNFRDKITLSLKFLCKRFLRLYPLYWLSIFLYIIFINNNFDYKTILLNLTMIQFFFNTELIQGIYWSLAFEILFYSSVVFLILTNIDKEIASKIFIFILLNSVILSLVSSYININLKFYAMYLIGLFFFGIITFYHKSNFNFVFKIACLSFLSLIILFAFKKFDFTLFNFKKLPLSEKNEITLLILANLLALITYCYCFFKKKSNKFFIFLGKISYSMFLTHGVAINIVSKYKFDGFFLSIILKLVLSILIAYLLHITFEKKFITLVKKINY